MKDDSEYPDWLWENLEEKPTLGDMVATGISNLEASEQRRALRGFNKERIKIQNSASRKKV